MLPSTDEKRLTRSGVKPVSTSRPDLVGDMGEATREGPRQRRADDRHMEWGGFEIAWGRVLGLDQLNGQRESELRLATCRHYSHRWPPLETKELLEKPYAYLLSCPARSLPQAIHSRWNGKQL